MHGNHHRRCVITDGPADPVSGLLECAITVHELFVTYQAAGFTEDQAFALVQTAIAASIAHHSRETT